MQVTGDSTGTGSVNLVPGTGTLNLEYLGAVPRTGAGVLGKPRGRRRRGGDYRAAIGIRYCGGRAKIGTKGRAKIIV